VAEGFLTNPSKVKGVKYLERYNPYPSSKILFTKFINAITDRGYNVILLDGSTNRTYQEQAALHRTNSSNADAGHSRHERGEAIDITIVDPKSGKHYSKNTSELEWRSTGIPQIAISMGLQWGDATNRGVFGTYIDRVHFQLHEFGGNGEDAITEPIYDEVTEYRNERGLDREGIFKNFKVNKFAFNFFLKNLQFDPTYREVKSRNIYQTDAEGSLLDVTITAKSKKGGK
jgi:hypothetical protein